MSPDWVFKKPGPTRLRR